MSTSTGMRATRFLLREFIGELLAFPFWWYSRGLVYAGGTLWRWLGWLSARMSLGMHVRYLGTPMYGETGWQGRIISFFVRLLLIGSRLIVLLFALIAAVVGMGLWIATPAAAVWMLIRQFFPG